MTRSTDPPLQRLDLRSVRADHFVVTESVHQARTTLSPHRHPFACIHLVEHGVYCESINGESHEVGAGLVLYKPAQADHSNRFDAAGATSVRVELHRPYAELDRALRAGGRCAAVLRLEPAHAAAMRITRLTALLRHPHTWSRLSVHSACLDLLAMLGAALERQAAARGARDQRLVDDTLGRLRQRLTDRTVSLASIARDVGVHPERLARTVRATTGQTVGEHIRALRVEYVAEALRNTMATIGTIATQAGFADQSHCDRVFRRVMGITPSAFRREVGHTGSSPHARPRLASHPR